MAEALETILDRQTPAQDVKSHFEGQMACLRDIVNYGTNLIPRCLESSPKDLTALVVLVVFLKHTVAMLDAVEIQLSAGAVFASQVSLRALFESQLYAHWILQSDSKNRAQHFYVWDLRRRKHWALRAIPGTSEHDEFSIVVQPLFPHATSNPLVERKDDALKEALEIDEKLESETYRRINQAFDDYWKKPYDPSWHAPLGPKSIRALSSELGRLHEYEVFYAQLSTITHASCFRKHVSVAKNEITLEPIRNLESIDFVLRMALTLSIKLYRRVLAEFRPGEVSLFDQKYQQEWRSPFMSIPSVTYKTISSLPP